MKRLLIALLMLCSLGAVEAQTPDGGALSAHNSDTDGYIKEWHNFVLKELPDTPERESLIQKAEDPEATDPTDPDDLNEMHSSVMDRGIEKILKETTASPEAIRRVQECVRENGLYNSIKTSEIEKILREDNVELHKTKEIASDIRKFEMSYKDIPLFKVSMGYNVQGALDAYMDETSEGMAVSVAVSGFFKVEADPNLRENAYNEAIHAAEKHLHNEKARNAVVTALKQCYDSHTCDVKALTTDLTEAGIEHIIEHAGLTEAQKKLAYAALGELRGENGAIVAASKEMLIEKLKSKGLSPVLSNQLANGLAGILLDQEMPNVGAIADTAVNEMLDKYLDPKQAAVVKSAYGALVQSGGDMSCAAGAAMNSALDQAVKNEEARNILKGALNDSFNEGKDLDLNALTQGLTLEYTSSHMSKVMSPEGAAAVQQAVSAFAQAQGDAKGAAGIMLNNTIDKYVKDPVAKDIMKESMQALSDGEQVDFGKLVSGLGSEYISSKLPEMKIPAAQKENLMDLMHGIANADNDAVRGALKNSVKDMFVEAGYPPEEAEKLMNAIFPPGGGLPDFAEIYTTIKTVFRAEVEEKITKGLEKLCRNEYVAQFLGELGINAESLMHLYDLLTVENLNRLSRMTLKEWKHLASQLFNCCVKAALNVAARYITEQVNKWIDKMTQKLMKKIMEISDKLGRFQKYVMGAVMMVSEAAKGYVGKAVSAGANKISRFLEWNPDAEEWAEREKRRVVPRSQVGKMGAPVKFPRKPEPAPAPAM